jgi:hypothetical protein
MTPADRNVAAGTSVEARREAEFIVKELKKEGFTTEETDPFAALADMEATKEALQGPERGTGRHPKGGLYNDHNDYFGKDRDIPE